MAHKTFISYKYSEAQGLRDEIIKHLGESAQFYQGETSESPDLTDNTTSTIKKHLSDMMYNTSVTILIISPHMKESKWIDWEIEYCLTKYSREDRTSHMNGIVGVIQKVNGGYEWFRNSERFDDGSSAFVYKEDYLYSIIKNNRFNQVPKQYVDKKHKTYDRLTGSYISFVDEDEFLSDPKKYIDNAFDKSENDGEGYEIHPSR